VFGLGLLLTSAGLSLAHALVASPGRLAEAGVLVTANLAAAAVRFLLFRGWVLR
jgi:hypothetical protein